MHLHGFPLLLAFTAALLNPISASAQTDAECAAAYDANGIRVARAYAPRNDAVILIPDQGRVARFRINKGALTADSTLYFTEASCAGDPFMIWNEFQPVAHLAGTDAWYPDTTIPTTTRFANSKMGPGSTQCTPESVSIPTSVPALNFTLPTFTPPFHLEPEPCFIPEDPDPEQIINACMKNKGGALRIVADPADCTSRETPISWVGE